MPLLFIPVLAQALSVMAGDASEMRFRVDSTGQFVDLTTTGRIALDLKLRRTTWTLFYAPSVTQLGLGSSTSSLFVTQTGGLTTRLRLTPRTSVTVTETGTFGQQNFRALAVSAPQQTFQFYRNRERGYRATEFDRYWHRPNKWSAGRGGDTGRAGKQDNKLRRSDLRCWG